VSEREQLPSTSQHDRRITWEQRYRDRPGEAFKWFVDSPPDQLVDLVERRMHGRDGALDIGCGPGVASSYLAKFFTPTVGLDIALSAVSQARDRARSEGVGPSFVVAEAPVLPFRDGSFSLVFDRGCLQGIPRQAWQPYFREVTRLLRDGGTFQLFVSKPTKRFPPLFSAQGLRARLRWYLRRRGPQFLSEDLLKSLAGPALHVVQMDKFPFQPTAGPQRAMIHAIFQKAQNAA
jgi:SAM-dependent methyltransferase